MNKFAVSYALILCLATAPLSARAGGHEAEPQTIFGLFTVLNVLATIQRLLPSPTPRVTLDLPGSRASREITLHELSLLARHSETRLFDIRPRGNIGVRLPDEVDISSLSWLLANMAQLPPDLIMKAMAELSEEQLLNLMMTIEALRLTHYQTPAVRTLMERFLRPLLMQNPSSVVAYVRRLQMRSPAIERQLAVSLHAFFDTLPPQTRTLLAASLKAAHLKDTNNTFLRTLSQYLNGLFNGFGDHNLARQAPHVLRQIMENLSDDRDRVELAHALYGPTNTLGVGHSRNPAARPVISGLLNPPLAINRAREVAVAEEERRILTSNPNAQELARAASVLLFDRSRRPKAALTEVLCPRLVTEVLDRAEQVPDSHPLAQLARMIANSLVGDNFNPFTKAALRIKRSPDDPARAMLQAYGRAIKFEPDLKELFLSLGETEFEYLTVALIHADLVPKRSLCKQIHCLLAANDEQDPVMCSFARNACRAGDLAALKILVALGAQDYHFSAECIFDGINSPQQQQIREGNFEWVRFLLRSFPELERLVSYQTPFMFLQYFRDPQPDPNRIRLLTELNVPLLAAREYRDQAHRLFELEGIPEALLDATHFSSPKALTELIAVLGAYAVQHKRLDLIEMALKKPYLLDEERAILRRHLKGPKPKRKEPKQEDFKDAKSSNEADFAPKRPLDQPRSVMDIHNPELAARLVQARVQTDMLDRIQSGMVDAVREHAAQHNSFNPNFINSHGESYLHFTLRHMIESNTSIDVLFVLLREIGVDPTLTNSDSETALQMAERLCNENPDHVQLAQARQVLERRLASEG